MPNKAPAYTPAMNQQARNFLIARCVDAWQNIFSQAYTGTDLQGQVVNVTCRNVGLVKRFVIRVRGTVTNPSGPTQTLTTLAAANFFSQVVLTDLNNNVRIQTSGWHLTMVASAKARLAYGSATTSAAQVQPFGYGVNYNTQTGFGQGVQVASSSISSNTTSNFDLFFEVPVAYGDFDLRGAIFANVTSGTFNLQLTFNPAALVATGVDATLAMYQSSTSTKATLTAVTLDVYQNYLDQIPVGQNGFPILPMGDLSVAYLMQNTALSGLVQNQDFPVAYANYRDFLSTSLVYDNNGVLNPGTDISYFALQSANFTNIFKIDPFLNQLMTRLRINQDTPTGSYYFDHRLKPISSNQYGNMNLNVNPSSVTAGASLLVGWEMFAYINQITQAGSLQAS